MIEYGKTEFWLGLNFLFGLFAVSEVIMAKEKGGKKGLAPRIESEAKALALPLIEQAGCTLWDVCFEKEGAMWYLRVLFDSEEGIDSDRCEEISKPVNELFDKQGFIEQVDILEIGTPGIFKKLRKPEHFREYIGKRIRAQVKSDKGERFVIGSLDEYDEENSQIVIDGETIRLKACIKVNAEPLDIETQLDEIEEDETLEQSETEEAVDEGNIE